MTAFKRKMSSSAQFAAAVYKPSIVCEFWKIAAPSMPLRASGMVGGGEGSSCRHALTKQSSQGSPGQIKHARQSRCYVESVSSNESKVNKNIECVAIRFIPQCGTSFETSLRCFRRGGIRMQKRCLLKHFKTLQFSSHGSKVNLA